jgi:hypothetical protein
VQPERLGLQAFAANRDITLRLTQQQTLHENQRRGDGNDRNDDDSHQLVRRDAELVGELVEVCGQDEHVLRVT